MTSTPTVQTGANVRAEMARKGISQAALGTAVSISQPGLSKRLRGATPFDINEIVRISIYLGVPLDQLLSGLEVAS